MATTPTLVVFDLGGVIVKICRSWAEGCRAAGIEVRGDESMGTPESKAARRACSEAYQTGKLTCEQFAQRLAATTGGLYTPEEVTRIHDAWLLGEYQGVNRLVRTLRTAGVATGVLSNTNHAHWERMTRVDYPTPRLVDHLHASHLLGLLKPGLEIFREFHRRAAAPGWQDGDAGRIVFFDDLAENVEAARAVGWQAELIDHAGDTARQMERHLRARGVM